MKDLLKKLDNTGILPETPPQGWFSAESKCKCNCDDDCYCDCECRCT